MPRLGLGLGAAFIESGSQRGARAAADTTSFISTWTVSGDETARTVTLPLSDSAPHLTLNFTIDWGDGSSTDTVTAYNDSERIHVYAEDGTYEVTMGSESHEGASDRVGDFKFNNGGDKAKLVGISQWGSYCQRVDDAFWGCSNLVITAEDAPDLTPLTGRNTGLAHFFDGCTALTSVGSATDWDVSNIESFAYMFRSCPNFNEDITMWDTGTCITFQSMFQSASTFNQAIGVWDTTMTGTTTGFPSMFQSATAFNQNLNGWNWTNNVDSWGTFNTATSFQNGGVNPNWNMTKTQYFVEMFQSSNFNRTLSGCTGIGTATGGYAWYKNMFAYNDDFDQNVGHFVVSNIKSGTYGMGNMFLGATLSTANYNATLIAWADDQNATDSVGFHGGNSEPTGDGDTARADLISTDSWTITDGN